MKKYLYILLMVGVCLGQTKEENAGKIIESAGNDIVEYVNDNYRAFYIGDKKIFFSFLMNICLGNIIS